MRIVLCQTPEEAYRKSAKFIKNRVLANPRMRLGLWNSVTAYNIYEYLIADSVKNGTSWVSTRFFGYQEYVGIKKDNPNTFQNILSERFLKKVGVKDMDMNVFFPSLDDSPIVSCKKYDDKIYGFGGLDLQLIVAGQFGNLGLNIENYLSDTTRVASLPDQFIMTAVQQFGEIDNVPKSAMIMGMQTLKMAKEILVVAIGKHKSDAVLQLTAGPKYKNTPIAQLLNHPNITLIVDRDASSKLPEREGLERAALMHKKSIDNKHSN